MQQSMTSTTSRFAYHGRTEAVTAPEIRERLFNQIVFKTAAALACCRYVSHKVVEGGAAE